ncbi:TPA: hypothetical protein N0F65_012827 [Lagenidium giganteum]|uniref:DNA polymerase alpha subunit B n=1 Tax=Lagenidium giganteum TaxID=4803 RepID=A0AAV2YG66_9STRA|nr:TPA: hypothetical protein N0F65_012827 [Lagenidium giganteum]
MAGHNAEQDAQAVRNAFASCNLDVAEDAISTCISICSEFSLTADELAAQWDAYSMNQQITGTADAGKLAGFRSKLAQDRTTKGASASSSAQKRRPGRSSTTPVIKREVKTEGGSQLDALYAMKSPETKHSRSFTSPLPASKMQKTNPMFSPSSQQSPPGNNYANRVDAGKTATEFNAHLKNQLSMLGEQESEALAVVEAPFPERNLQPNAPYMYTPLYQRALALDEQLVEYEQLVKEQFNIEELWAVGDATPAQVTVVGRIVCEAAEGKLNASVIQLEGSRKTCGGQRVLLDVSGVPNLQLFPGKIVALEGILADVRSPMVVKKFLDPIVAPMPTSSKIKIEEWQGVNSPKPLRVVTACGPFTTADNTDYLPLNDLLQVVISQKPDVFIVVGPFIDSMHSSFSEGLAAHDDMIMSFEDVFIFKVMTLLNNVLASNSQLQVVMVPSLRDAHHDFVYPQPPFNKKKACEAFEDAAYTKRVHMMPNPCTFSLNGIVFGVSALDVVVQLSSNELYRSQGRDQNRLLRLSEKIVDQRSFYPIFPPPAGGDAPIDLRYMQQFQFERTPDVIVLPSILNRFCGRVKDSIGINPGQLCKGQAGGTFAMMTILPLSKDKLASAPQDEVPHQVPDRTSVEIKRI